MLVFSSLYSPYLKIWVLPVHSIQAKLTSKHSIHNKTQNPSQKPKCLVENAWKSFQNKRKVPGFCWKIWCYMAITKLLVVQSWIGLQASRQRITCLYCLGLFWIVFVLGWFCVCVLCVCGYRVLLTQTKPWIWRWYSAVVAASLSHVAAQCLPITHLVAHLVLGQRARLQFQNKTKQAFVFMPSVLQRTISLSKAFFQQRI